VERERYRRYSTLYTITGTAATVVSSTWEVEVEVEVEAVACGKEARRQGGKEITSRDRLICCSTRSPGVVHWFHSFVFQHSQYCCFATARKKRPLVAPKSISVLYAPSHSTLADDVTASSDISPPSPVVKSDQNTSHLGSRNTRPPPIKEFNVGPARSILLCCLQQTPPHLSLGQAIPQHNTTQLNNTAQLLNFWPPFSLQHS